MNIVSGTMSRVSVFCSTEKSNTTICGLFFPSYLRVVIHFALTAENINVKRQRGWQRCCSYVGGDW